MRLCNILEAGLIDLMNSGNAFSPMACAAVLQGCAHLNKPVQKHTHTHTHSNYFAASTAQTAPNIRQKLAIWDSEHKRNGAAAAEETGLLKIILIADKTTAESSRARAKREKKSSAHPQVAPSRIKRDTWKSYLELGRGGSARTIGRGIKTGVRPQSW